ncbi:MAG TPA: DNA/RNA non-specific endonuclease, partial [Kutzneria sp.]|nr:DNA/RNA non-specific endonuclease [Kutzneria sp.]
GGGRPVVKHRPLPPPPPLWFVNVHKREHRQPPGGTVKPRPPQYWIDPPADHIVDPGPELTKNSNKTTLSGPVSVFNAPQADAGYDYRSDEADCLNGDLPHTIWYGPLQRVTDDDGNRLGYRATGAAACLTTTQTAKRGPEKHPMDGRDSDDECAEAAGHLIAYCFYGADHPANLVPLNQNKTNVSRMYHAVEKQIKVQIQANQGPIYYRVTPHFQDGQLVPDSIFIHATGHNFDCQALIPNSPDVIPEFRGCRDGVVK